MNNVRKESFLKFALVAFGIVFCLVYPLSIVWPSGWQWHGGDGVYYFQMICGVYFVLGVFLVKSAKQPARHRSLISFTVWSSVVHALIMAAQAVGDHTEHGHLVGDVPALLIAAGVLAYLSTSLEDARERDVYEPGAQTGGSA